MYVTHGDIMQRSVPIRRQRIIIKNINKYKIFGPNNFAVRVFEARITILAILDETAAWIYSGDACTGLSRFANWKNGLVILTDVLDLRYRQTTWHKYTTQKPSIPVLWKDGDTMMSLHVTQ